MSREQGYMRPQSRAVPRKTERPGQFTEELRELMYACGDCVSPNQGTMNLVENYVIEYLYSLLLRANNRSSWRGGAGSKIDINDLLHYLEEDDELIYHRVKCLLEEYEKQHSKQKKTDSMLEAPDNL